MNQKPLEALKSAGKKPGLEIWVLKTVKPPQRTFHNPFTSQQPKPEPEYEVFAVPPAKQGIFYGEDLYIVLYTHPETGQKNIHFWFGRAYKGTPPPWVDTFENLELDWKATQHFEFQGHECELFESYFNKIQPAIRYKRGQHPDPYAERLRGDTRFYKLECLDKAHYRVKEIPFNIELMTKEECFILDTDYNTRTYMSDRTDVNERNKSIIVANKIREQDHEGNGDVEVVDLTTFSNEADRQAYARTAKLLEEQEEPPPEIDYDVPDEDPAGPNVHLNSITLIGSDDIDTCYPPRFKYVPRPRKKPKTEEKKTLLGRAKSALSKCFRRMLGQNVKGEVEFEIPSLEEKFYRQLVTKPLKQDNMNSRKCYILEQSPGRGIFLWVGKSSDPTCKQELTETLRLEIRRCDQKNDVDNNGFEMEELNFEAYTIKSSKKNDKKNDKIDDQKDEKTMISPRWTHIIKIMEGDEIVKFKKYFHNWK